LAWLKANFHDTHDADGNELHENGCIFKASVDDPVIVIFEGHESHYAPEVLDFCLANGIHLVCRPPHTSQVSQGEDVINFKVLKKLIREAVGRRLARRVLESLHGGGIAAVSCTNRDLMDCVCEQWETAFGEGNCLKAWAVTGISPFNRCMKWKLLAAERLKQQHVEAMEAAVPSLNWDNFNPGAMFEQLGEASARVPVTDADGNAVELDAEEEAELMSSRFSSRAIWKEVGGVTGASASQKIFRRRQERMAAAAAADAKRKEREALQQQRRVEAASSVDAVKAVVIQKGWITGGRGGLTTTLLRDVLRFFGQSTAPAEKAVDLVARVKQILGWTAEGGFPGQAGPQPPPPPALDQVPGQ
jgi:hypothetical protein